MAKANYIVTGNSITVLINNRPEIIDNTHPNFEAVENALKSGASENDILNLMNVSIAVQNFGEGKVTVKDGEIMYLGDAVHSALATRIMSLMEQGFDIKPFTNFMENLFENPSNRAVTETYGFLEACNLPITEDGCFLAYKKVKGNYNDCYTNTISNAIGETPEVPRNKVDEDSERTCSYGLHVASYSYMAHYPGEKIMICKVNPKDVVAVPSDYNNAKMRVCKYEVVNEVDLKDEQIPENVIKDEDAYDSSLRPFKNIEEALMAVRQDSYRDITERLKVSVTDSSEDLLKFDVEFDKMNNRTKNWRNILLNLFSPNIDEEDFHDEVEALQEQLDEDIDESDHEPECYEDYADESGEDSMLDDINSEEFQYIKEVYGQGTILSDALSGITNSTYMWRNQLRRVYNGTSKLEAPEKTEKVKFKAKVEAILPQLNSEAQNELALFLEANGNLNPNFTMAAFRMSDLKGLVKVIIKIQKKKLFKKKEFLGLFR